MPALCPGPSLTPLLCPALRFVMSDAEVSGTESEVDLNASARLFSPDENSGSGSENGFFSTDESAIDGVLIDAGDVVTGSAATA